MATLRELKGRITSVASTEKTTSAMKMISSAKMHKSTAALKRMQPYRSMVEHVMGHLLVTDVEFSSPLIESREVKKVAIAVFGSDDGLCGAYNINIYKQLQARIAQLRSQFGNDVQIVVLPVGRKMVKATLKINDEHIKVEEVDLNTRSNAQQLSDFTQMLRERFVNKEVDHVEVAYMHYVSTSRQQFRSEQILPVSYSALADSADKSAANSPCLFEPDANAIFNSVLPLYVRSTMQEIFIETTASEQSARVMAMQTANDNARELLESLNLEYNKLRQQGITTELLDILGGQVER